jgi:hypothetical protein
LRSALNGSQSIELAFLIAEELNREAQIERAKRVRARSRVTLA